MGIKEVLTSFLRVLTKGQRTTHYLLLGSVLLLQIGGSFPFRWSRPPHHPQFSRGLFLWAIVAKTMGGIGLYFHLQNEGVLTDWIGQSLDDLIVKVSIVSYACFASVCHVIMPIKSQKMAEVLGNLPPFLNRSKHVRDSYFAYYLLALLEIWVAFHFLNNIMSCPITLRLTMTVGLFWTMPTYVSAIYLFKASAVTLSNYLVETVKQSLSFTKCFSNFTFVPHNLISLFLLEKQIRQITKTRNGLVACFVSVTSSSLLGCVVGIIGLLYKAIIHEINFSIWTVILLGYLALIHCLCDIGQGFQDNVEIAIEMLRNHSCDVSNIEVKAQVSRLLGLLEPLRRFSVCGWYVLDKTLILSMSSVVVTYLVVLLQIKASAA